jgi:hypothetical protein
VLGSLEWSLHTTAAPDQSRILSPNPDYHVDSARLTLDACAAHLRNWEQWFPASLAAVEATVKRSAPHARTSTRFRSTNAGDTGARLRHLKTNLNAGDSRLVSDYIFQNVHAVAIALSDLEARRRSFD